MPKENRLRKPSEFRRVYEHGTRLEGRFVTVFILPSETSFQRLGITASKKRSAMRFSETVQNVCFVNRFALANLS
ncbi:MAG: ribonuclease P protein component [Pyrinomonadaceae bacterium]